MPSDRNQAGEPGTQQREQAGTPMPHILKAIGAGLMGGLGGILLDLLTVKSRRPQKTSGRCKP